MNAIKKEFSDVRYSLLRIEINKINFDLFFKEENIPGEKARELLEAINSIRIFHRPRSLLSSN